MRSVLRVFNATLEIAEIVRENSVAIIQSNGFRAHVYGGLASRWTGVPNLWAVHTAEKPGISTSLILSIPTGGVVANSPATAEYFVSKFRPTTLIWPGVDLKALTSRCSRAELAARFGLPMTGRWITVGSRLQRYKGQEYLVRATAAVAKSFPDVHAIIAGGALFGMESNFPAELKKLARELGVEDRVHLTGFINDSALLYGLIAESEFLAHTALQEDFGLIIAEAQALGKAVLAFNISGPRAIIEDGHTGRLVSPGDEAAWNHAFFEMLSNPGQLEIWGRNGQARVKANFDVRVCARQLERLYDQVSE